MCDLGRSTGFFEEVLGNPDHPQWMAVLNYVSAYGCGRPLLRPQLTTPEPLTIRVVNE
jgi:hypothetical protein